MKNYLKLLTFAFFAIAISSCTDEGDTELPGEIASPIFSEIFDRPGQPNFNFENWTNFAEAGNETWFLNDYAGNYYVDFSSFNSGDASNIAWLISPALDIDTASKKRLIFQSAQYFATNAANTFDVLVSDDFDGTNVMAATWTVKTFRKPTYSQATNYDFVNSGVIDLSEYSGTIHIAFRVKGDGLPNSNFDGGFQIDNVKVF